MSAGEPSPEVVTGPDVDLRGRIVVVATRNPGKVVEFRRLMAETGARLVGLDDAGFRGPLDEPGPGYEENAVAKARAVSDATGLPALADDSGIEVPGLGGWPGPRSARWLGDEASDGDRLAGLLEEVSRRSPEDRRARYVCVVALALPRAATLTARGECEGTLVAPSGGRGFGYDPAFLSADLGVRFGEAADADKDRVSHRGRAFNRLRLLLAAPADDPAPGSQ